MIKYFYDRTKGLNSDIDRHREEEQKIQQKISELESIETPNNMQIVSLRVYRNFLYLLELSKAEVVEKLGKRKYDRNT